MGRNPPRSGSIELVGTGDIIAIAPAALRRMARAHLPVLAIDHLASQKTWILVPQASRRTARIVNEKRLHCFPQLFINDCLVLTRISFTFVNDEAAVDAVPEHVVKRASPEDASASVRPTAPALDLRSVTLTVQFLDQRGHGACRQVAAHDVTNLLSLPFVHHQFALEHFVPERNRPSHPQALLLRCRDLIPDAFPGDLALELSEAEQHVEREPAHAGGRVEALGDANEACPSPVEYVHDFGEVGKTASQPIDLVEEDDVDLARLDLGEEALEPLPLHIPT